MKKIGLFVAAIAILSSCKTEPVDYVLFSGKTANTTTKEATLFGVTNRAFRQKIKIAEDGTFTDTLRVKSGDYMFVEARNATPLHLDAGNNIKVNYDANDYAKTLAITGTGAEISNYLIAKAAKGKELMGKGTEVYVKEEADYKAVMNSIKEAQEKLLQSTKGIPAEYAAKEKRNINYEYLSKIQMYKNYHAYYAKKEGFEPSADFLSELKTVSYDNEEDYAFSSAYKGLVSGHYNDLAQKMAKEEGIDEDLAAIKAINTCPSQTMKNSMLFDAANYGITYTSDPVTYYKAYMAGSTNEENNAKITKSYDVLKTRLKGMPSPTFENLENNAGGTTSLSDLKGKYVYVDVWATWCGPCKAEIPFLQKVEKNYHGKKIHFVSLSIDVKKDHDAWKKMIVDMKLGGIQILGENDWNSAFTKAYLIKAIPRFILIDPKGDIVTANAPRPSDKKLIDLFNELKI